MERIVDIERLYSSIKKLIEEKDDIKEIKKNLGKVHLKILKRDIFHIVDEKECDSELKVYNKIAFYLLTKLTNYQYDKDICLQGLEIAAFCFEVLFKSQMYTVEEEIEYGLLSSICYSLADNQANSIILANRVLAKCSNIDIELNYTHFYCLFLARKFKTILKMQLTEDKVKNAIIVFSKSMIYRNNQFNNLSELKNILVQLRNEESKYYYMFRLVFLVSEKMNIFSIRNLIEENYDIKEYIDVLTQKEVNNIYELWQSQSFLFSMLNEIKETEDMFFLSLPTSAGKTLVSEIILYKFLAHKKGIAIYVAPTIALTNEIENSFIRRFRKVGIHIITEIEFDEERDNVEPAILILTPEKLDLLTRKQPELLDEIQCIVFDEFHKISDGQRGWFEETLIAWFVYNKNKYNYKIIMMSAIVDGLKESLADIRASVYEGNWTPSKKIFGMFYLPKDNVKVYGNNVKKNEIISESYCLRIKYDLQLVENIKNVFQRMTYGKKTIDGKDSKKSNTKYDLCWKAINMIEEDTILVYFYTKKDIKNFISRCKQYCNKTEDDKIVALKKTIARQLGNNHPLVSALDYKVAFHNADLPEDVRVVIESAYKNKLIKVLACTTTLADGVNLPVSTLIMGSVFSYDKKKNLNLADYKNIAGRIGRALIDTEGKIFLIKYPDVYEEDVVDRFNEYYYGEKITNSLESSFDSVDESDLEIIEQHVFAEMDNESKNIIAMIERIQIFVFSLYEKMTNCDIEEFQDGYNKAFFLRHSLKTERIMKKYVSKYYDLAREIPIDFLQKCNKTGVSYNTNKILYDLAKETNNLYEVYEVFSENLYLKLLKCNEFLPEDDNVNHYNAIKDWLEGCSYMDLRETFFKDDSDLQRATERCTKYIRRMFQYTVPWALSALLVYMEENTDAYNKILFLIRCVKYGTLEENVVTLCESGIKSRELAIALNNLYEKDINNKTGISDWVINVQKERLERSFGNKFDRYILEQIAKYRTVKREISHYFENNKAITCVVMGVKFYDFFKIGADYFKNDKRVILHQDMKNDYDMYAVKVMTIDSQYMLGYIPMKCSEEIFDIIESGYQLKCTIYEILEDKIRIRIEKV